MEREWILLTKETRRRYATSTWVPLRASITEENGDIRHIGFVSETFACGSVAFPPENRTIAEKLGWSDIGIGHRAEPTAFKDGSYASIEQYQYNDNEAIGINLVFEHQQPVLGGRLWILNPDLIVALRLIKDGTNWVRPEEDFVVVAREVLDVNGHHTLIEIRREFLMDYLAARNLSLRLAYYSQRVENVQSLDDSAYAGMKDQKIDRDEGRFELLTRTLDDVYGGSWAALRVWRTDVDEDEDAPIMGPDRDGHTEYEKSEGYRKGSEGVRVEGEFWREEWIDHLGVSVRVRNDKDKNLPNFIVETDGSRMASSELDNEDVGRWLFFRTSIMNELLAHRGFSLEWYTAETGALNSTSGYATHFGINSSDLITVYAYDIAKLDPWEQHIWAAHNVAPDGKVSSELLSAQVRAKVASTHAVEDLLFKSMLMLEAGFNEKFGSNLFKHEIEKASFMQSISRFVSKDQESLLRLAKELVRVFSDRLNIKELRKLSSHVDKDTLGSNKLLQDILSQKVGLERAREVFATIAGAYDMRVGDAHPTGSKIKDAIKLAGIDDSNSYLKQGEQLINNFGESIWWIGKHLFGE